MASSWERYKWNPSIGSTVATSGGITSASKEAAF